MGFRAAVRVGYARPIGSFEPPVKLSISNVFRHQTPITVDVGYKPHENFYVGAYGTIAFGEVGTSFEDLCEVSNCSVLGYRLGAMVTAELEPDGRLNPWLGLAGGYDLSFLHVEERRGELSLGVRGPEFPQFLFGVDYRLTEHLGFGPLIHFALGWYSDRSVDTPRYGLDAAIDEPDLHTWFIAGGRMLVFP